MQRTDPDAGRAAALVTAVDRLAARPELTGPPADRRWRAARAVVAAQLAARLPAGELEAAGLRADAALAGDPALELLLPPPSIAWLAGVYPRLLAPVARKRSGAWFTLPSLAEPTVARTLAPMHARGRDLRIVDPAVGGGAFLLAALRMRVATGARAADVAARELVGRDLDATAATLAAAALHEACGDEAPPLLAIAANVCAGDGLLELDDGTFDAVVGNPPWETLQATQREAMTAAEAARLAARTAALRRRFCDQGRGKLYTYRLFVERALALLRPGGRLGMIVPASLWFDRDAAPLRTRLLDECRWEWLFALENRERLFAIDGRYRFGPIVVEKGGSTAAVRAAFLHTDVGEWQSPTPTHLLYPRELVRAVSPHSGAFVEVRSPRDLELLRRMTAAGSPLLGRCGLATWRQGDFNMTSDRAHFRSRADCERNGYAPHPDGTWRRGDGDPVLRPLHQGAMIHVLQPNAGGYAGGEGRAVRWRQPAAALRLEPQYLVDAARLPPRPPVRVALRALTNATNERTAIACLLADEPCGNSLGVLTARDVDRPLLASAFVAGVLASLQWDWLLRQRLGGTNVNGFVLADMVLPRAATAQRTAIARCALRLGAILPWHQSLWHLAAAEGWGPASRPEPPDPPTRGALLIELELAVAAAFGLGPDELAHVLRDCDHPCDRLADRAFARRLDPKGFWRIDRSLPAALRLPVRILAAARGAGGAADQLLGSEPR